MELQEFIKTTLVQITNGIIDAQKELEGSGCLINPEGFGREAEQIKRGYENRYRSIQKVRMNVVLSVSESEGSKSGIGVAKFIKAGIDNEENTSTNKYTSVDFEVPIAFPIMDEK